MVSHVKNKVDSIILEQIENNYVLKKKDSNHISKLPRQVGLTLVSFVVSQCV